MNEKRCPSCNHIVKDTRKYKKKYCSTECAEKVYKQKAAAYYKTYNMGKKRVYKPCEICGFSLFSNNVRLDDGREMKLCPNHRALIIYGIKTLDALLLENKNEIL